MELAVSASQEVREKEYEERVKVALRRAERVEARRQSAAARGQSLALRRGGIRRGERKQIHCSSSSSYVVCLLNQPMLFRLMFFPIVLDMFKCLESIASSIASSVLLVSVLCIHTRKLLVWRAGACHIDSMCRLGYG